MYHMLYSAEIINSPRYYGIESYFKGQYGKANNTLNTLLETGTQYFKVF
jgi:hypothetical protein